MPPQDRGSALYNFGAALFAALPNSNNSEPPDAFRVLLINKHASPVLRLAIFQSCRSGRQWVLQTAPNATIFIDLTADMPHATRQTQQRALLHALIVRGKLPTHLRVQFDFTAPVFALTTTLFGLLAATASNITLPDLHFAGRSADSVDRDSTELDESTDDSDAEYEGSDAEAEPVTSAQQGASSSALQLWGVGVGAARHEAPDPVYATALLHTAIAALPRLSSLSLQWWPLELPPTLQWPQITSLELDSCQCSLLPPSHLPGLRELAVNRSEIGLSLPPYLTQVTALHLCEDQWENHWPALFSPATTTHTLTTLSISSELTGRLLGLLLMHAPQLSVLSVECVSVETDEYRGSQWQLKQLNSQHLWSEDDEAVCIARLPTSTAGPLPVCVRSLHLRVTDEQGLPTSLNERLHDFVFHCDTVTVDRYRPYDAPIQPPTPQTLAAWRLALQQLRQLQAPGATVHLSGAVGRDILPTLAAELPSLGRLRVCLHMQYSLTDAGLAAVLQLGTHVRVLSVHRVSLCDEPAWGAVWPWDELMVGRTGAADAVDVKRLVKLPHPSTHGVPPLLQCTGVSLYDSVMKVGVERVRDWLRHVRFSGERTVFTLHAPTQHQSDALRAQCHALQAVRFHSAAAEHSATVQLYGWDMTRTMLAALQGLPQWACRLVFDDCTWPLPHSEYRHMALHVPTSYTAWRVGDRLTPVYSETTDELMSWDDFEEPWSDQDDDNMSEDEEEATSEEESEGDGEADEGVSEGEGEGSDGDEGEEGGTEASPARRRYDNTVYEVDMESGTLLESIEEGVCEYRSELGLLPISVDCWYCP